MHIGHEKYLSLEEFREYIEKHRIALRYRSVVENKRPHQWWNLDMPTIEKLLRDIAQTILGPLKDIPAKDRELLHLSRTAGLLSKVHRKKRIQVALIGAQGAGKSLLINALFDLNGLSLTGADGNACTSSVVKYRFHRANKDGDELPKYYAEVEFMDAKGLKATITENAKN